MVDLQKRKREYLRIVSSPLFSGGECCLIRVTPGKIKNSCNAVRSHMIKKARDVVGSLYSLERFEDIDERLRHIRHLLADHTYSVRQGDRKDPPEVCNRLLKL